MSATATAAVTHMPEQGRLARSGVGTQESSRPEIAQSRKREHFLPLTRNALLDRLTRTIAWPNGNATEARRFFRFLDYWRQQSYSTKLMDLEHAYEPFSPDSDLLITRKFSPAESAELQRRFVDGMKALMQNANYTQVDPSQVEIIMSRETHYGLDLHVDMSAFEEILIFYRGKTTRREERRDRRRLYLSKQTFELPIFQRLFILFKLKPADVRVREIMATEKCDRKEAERTVKKLRGLLPAQIRDDYIYMKLFKNIPQADLEMIFPNTKIKFRMFDKLKLGATGGAGLGAGIFGAAGKIALLSTNPVAAAGAAVGLGGVAFRQVMNVVNQKNRYMVTMAQNLYFHAMADNRGVMTLMADHAAEEDIKEEMLLYSVLAKEPVSVGDLDEVDEAIEQYLRNTYGIEVDFDVRDALMRLIADGIVSQLPDGTLKTLSPAEGARHIDALWDAFLDKLPSVADHNEGDEFDAAVARVEASAGA
jgi:hypothetical protein